MDSAKAQEFLDKHGELVADLLEAHIGRQEQALETALAEGWTALAKISREEITEGTQAMRELELLRGEG